MERPELFSGNELRLAEVFEPGSGFVGLIQRHPDLGGELGVRPSSTGGTMMVGCAGRRPHQLPGSVMGFGSAEHGPREPSHVRRKREEPLPKLCWSHTPA
jgi:hypothetical protein